MGTSTNQPSPNRPTWAAVRRVLADSSVPLGRAANELWTIACRDGEVDVLEILGSQTVYDLAMTAGVCEEPTAAIDACDQIIATAKTSSTIVELARRALVRASVTKRDDRIASFAEALFAEVIGYYVSRDISGMVGRSDRFKSVDDVIRFKKGISEAVRVMAGQHKPSTSSLEAWRSYITAVTGSLTGGRV